MDKLLANNPKSAIDTIAKVISDLAATCKEHPGFMANPFGFEVLHADWPAYPGGHGIRYALFQLAEFPFGMEFIPIDNIDECTLFITAKVQKGDEFNKNHYHVAIWDEDLIELTYKNFILGTSVSERRLEYSGRFVSLTVAGQHAVPVYELTSDLHYAIVEATEELLLIKRYDSAIRDASTFLEERLRELSGTKHSGRRLIEDCFGARGALINSNLTNTVCLALRATYRRFFKYVRNDFAHNYIDIDFLTTARLIRRCSLLLETAERLKESCGKDSQTG